MPSARFWPPNPGPPGLLIAAPSPLPIGTDLQRLLSSIHCSSDFLGRLRISCLLVRVKSASSRGCCSSFGCLARAHGCCLVHCTFCHVSWWILPFTFCRESRVEALDGLWFGQDADSAVGRKASRMHLTVSRYRAWWRKHVTLHQLHHLPKLHQLHQLHPLHQLHQYTQDVARGRHLANALRRACAYSRYDIFASASGPADAGGVV